MNPRSRMAVVTTAHPWRDPRVFQREMAACLDWGLEVHAFLPLDDLPQPWGWSGSPRLVIHPLLRRTKPLGRLERFALAAGVWRDLKREGPFGLVHFHDPELVPAMALLALMDPGAYTLYDIHEDLPLQMASKAYLPGWARMPGARMAAFLLRLARELFSGFAPATEAIARQWPPDRTRVLHNYPKAVFALPGPAPAPDPSRVIYVGGLSRERGIPMALEAVRIARQRVPDLRLELVGWVMDPPTGEGVERAVGEGWCTHIPWLDPEALARHASGVGIGLVTLLPRPNYLESLPTKLFEYMALGIPVLASDFPLWRDLVAGSGAGRVVPPAPDPLAQALVAMASCPEALDRHAALGRKAYEERFRWETEKGRLLWHLKKAGMELPAAKPPGGP